MLVNNFSAKSKYRLSCVLTYYFTNDNSTIWFQVLSILAKHLPADNFFAIKLYRFKR